MRVPELFRQGVAVALRWRGVAIDVLALAALAVFVAWLLLPVYEQRTNLPGYDQYYHMAHLDYLAGQVEQGKLPTTTPMFGGFRFFLNTGGSYPSGVYFLNLPIRFLTGDSTTTYLWSLFLIFFFAAGGFYLGFKARFGRIPALLGGVVVITGPFQLTSVVPHGRWASLQAFAFLPAFAAASIAFLDRPNRFRFCVIAATSGLMMMAHPMAAYIGFFGVSAYALGWSAWNGTPARRFAAGAAAIVIGTLIAWALIPSGLFDRLLPQAAGEVFSAPTGFFADSGGPAGEAGAFSIGTWSFSSVYRGQLENYAGFAPLWLTVVIAVLQPRPRILATAGVVGVLYLVAFGNEGPIFSILPFSNILEPRRFLHAVHLFQGILLADALAYWLTGAGVLSLQLRSRAIALVRPGRGATALRVAAVSKPMAASLLVAVPGLVLLAVLWNRELVPMRNTLYTYAARAIVPSGGLKAEVPLLKELAGDGRYMAQGKTDYAEFYFALGAAGLDVLRDTEATYAATLMNVRVVDTDAGRRPQEVEKFHQLGFTENRRGAGGFTVLMHSDRPVVRLQQPSIRVLTVGSGTNPTGRRGISGGIDISRVDPEILPAFDAVILSGYTASDPRTARAMLDDFIARGGVVVVGDPRTDGADLWGSIPEYRPIPRRAFVHGITDTGVVDLGSGSEVGAFFPAFGEPAVSAVDPASDRFDLIREQRLGNGYLVRTCCSLGHHMGPDDITLLTEAVLAYFEDRLGEEILWPAPFPASIEAFDADLVKFDYSSEVPAPVVVSKPHDPRWRLTVGGQPVSVHPYAGVMLATLPAGSHSASLEYVVSPVSASAAAFTAGGVIALVMALGPLFAFMRGYGRTLPELASSASDWLFEQRRESPTPGPRVVVEAERPATVDSVIYDGLAMDGSPHRFRITPADQRNTLLVVPVTVTNQDSAPRSVRISTRTATASSLGGERFRALNTVRRSLPANGAAGSTAPSRFAPLWGKVVLEPSSYVHGELVFELPPGNDSVEIRITPMPRAAASFRFDLNDHAQTTSGTRI